MNFAILCNCDYFYSRLCRNGSGNCHVALSSVFGNPILFILRGSPDPYPILFWPPIRLQHPLGHFLLPCSAQTSRFPEIAGCLRSRSESLSNTSPRPHQAFSEACWWQGFKPATLLNQFLDLCRSDLQPPKSQDYSLRWKTSYLTERFGWTGPSHEWLSKKNPPKKRLPKSSGQKRVTESLSDWWENYEAIEENCYLFYATYRPYPESQKEANERSTKKTKKGHSSIWHPWMLKRSKVSSKKKKPKSNF